MKIDREKLKKAAANAGIRREKLYDMIGISRFAAYYRNKKAAWTDQLGLP